MARKESTACAWDGEERRARINEIEHAATVAARAVVHDMFSTIGMDISTPEAVSSAQKDMIFLRSSRKSFIYLVIATVMGLLGVSR